MPRLPGFSHRRLYLLLAIVLGMCLVVALILYGATRGPSETTDTPPSPGLAGAPVFAFAVEASGNESFRPRGGVLIGSRFFVADSEGARLAVVDLTRGDDATLEFIPIAFDRPGASFPARPQPVGVAVIRDGSLLVTDPANGRLWKMAQDGTLLGDFPDQTERERSELRKPVGIAVQGDQVYVTDVADQRIKVYSDTGRFLRTLGGAGYLPGQLAYPNGLAVDRDRRVWVADSNNRRVQLLDTDGQPLRVIERVESTVPFDLPRSVALDRLGRVHVVDTFGQAVYVFSADGRVVLSYGQRSHAPDRVRLPEGVTIDAAHLVVSDAGNRRVLVYTY